MYIYRDILSYPGFLLYMYRVNQIEFKPKHYNILFRFQANSCRFFKPFCHGYPFINTGRAPQRVGFSRFVNRLRNTYLHGGRIHMCSVYIYDNVNSCIYIQIYDIMVKYSMLCYNILYKMLL